MKSFRIQDVVIGNDQPLMLIAGPCQIESQQHAIDMCGQLKEICRELGMGLIYKSSFDKANRTSGATQRGVGIDRGLAILNNVKNMLDVPILTDIHESYQAKLCADADMDVLQIPAFLCRQTDLLIAGAATGLAINIKKGQFLAPWDMKNVAEKIASAGNDRIMLCERGTTHGYNTLVVDMQSLPIMAETGYPIVFDATHSVQTPGGHGNSSGGNRQMVPYLARAAVATGCVAAVFIETHKDPDNAPSDGPNMVKLSELKNMLIQIQTIDQVTKDML